MAYQLDINGDTTFTTRKFKPKGATREYNKKVIKAPYTDYWFPVGDGRVKPYKYDVGITISGANQDDAIGILNDLLVACETATTIVVSDLASSVSYTYTVDAVNQFSSVPRTIGYNVDVSFALTKGTATDHNSNEVII